MSWNVKRDYRELKRWIEANYDRVSIHYGQKIALAAAGAADVYVGSSEFNSQAIMLAAKGLVGILDGDAAALDMLCQAVYANRCSLEFDAAYYYYHLPNGTAPCNLNDVSLNLARAVALGNFTDADAMATIIWPGLLDGLFGRIDDSRVWPFILRLYASWKGIAQPKSRVRPRSVPIYDRVLDYWDSADTSSLESALISACDLHVERSRASTDREDFEFSNPDYRLQPVEIMMVMRVRQCQGLEVPTVDHPIVNTVVAKLYGPCDVVRDPVMQAALAFELARVEAKKKQAGT